MTSSKLIIAMSELRREVQGARKTIKEMHKGEKVEFHLEPHIGVGAHGSITLYVHYRIVENGNPKSKTYNVVLS
jgi:hypothetical protein